MTVLDEIIAGVREDVAARQAQVPLDELKKRCKAQGFRATDVAGEVLEAWVSAGNMIPEDEAQP